MSSENVLIPFKFPYYWSIIFGTMPTRLKLQRSEEHQQTKHSADVNRKFVAVTIAWMTVVTTFIIRDIQASISWNPTQFFSMKVVAIFPNDFYCMRLIHNIEIWMVLIMCLKSGPKLPNIIEHFHSLGFMSSIKPYAVEVTQKKTMRHQSEEPQGSSYEKNLKCNSQIIKYYFTIEKLEIMDKKLTSSNFHFTAYLNKWKHLILKHRHLIMTYAFITLSPIAFELFLLQYETNNLDLQQFSQGTLHCIPLTINLQFCSLCMLLNFQFDDLNSQATKRNCNLTPKDVQQISQKHSEICYVTRQVYKVYEWQLLAETTIVTLTVFLYTYYALNPSNLIWEGYGEVIYCTLWILHYAGRLFTTCMSVSKVIMQAEETRKVILCMEKNDNFTNNHDEVTSLVNRVQNQDIRFDVCGFFHLEGTLIVSVCSWCISFILILLQFRKPT